MPDTGSILFQHLEDENNTGHTIIYVGNFQVVHATPAVENVSPGGVLCETLEDAGLEGEKLVVFSCINKHVAAEAARLARAWADSNIRTEFSSSMTHTSAHDYNEARVLGISEASKHPEFRIFGRDALYRAFKWASNKGEKSFSKNRGITCCPFVTACYQAAWIRYLFKSNDAIISTFFDKLKVERPSKVSKEERVDQLHITTESGKKLGKRPFPQFARVPGDISLDWEEAIRSKIKELTGIELGKFSELVTPALFVEAKFNSTRNLCNSLREDKAHWTEYKLIVPVPVGH